MHQLLDFVTVRLSAHYSRKLMDIANGRRAATGRRGEPTLAANPPQDDGAIVEIYINA